MAQPFRWVAWTAWAFAVGAVLGRLCWPWTGGGTPDAAGTGDAPTSALVVGALCGTAAAFVAAIRLAAMRAPPDPEVVGARRRRVVAACTVCGALAGFVRGLPPPRPPPVPPADVAVVEGTVVRAPRVLGPRASDEAPGDDDAGFDLDLGGVLGRVVVGAVAPGRLHAPPPEGLGGVDPGDGVRVLGRVRSRGPPRNPGGREPTPGTGPVVGVVCPSPAAVEVSEEPAGLAWLPERAGEFLHRETIGRLRAACAGDLPTADLLACLVVGERSGVDVETSRAFRDSGTAHLLAVSGLHLVLLVGGLVAVGRAVLPPRLRGPVGGPALAVAVLLYVAACRFEVPVVRAAIFVGVAAVARLATRRGATFDALALAAALVIGTDPSQAFDAGFQLSFAAVAGLAALTRRFREALFARLDLLARFPEAVSRMRLRAGSWFAQAFSASLAASVATAPVVAWHFGTAQPAGPIANLVAVPVFAVVLPSAVLFAVAGDLLPWLTAPLAASAAAALELSAGSFAGIPMTAGRPPPLLVALSVALLVVAARLRPWTPRHLLLPAVSWCAVAAAPAWVRPAPGPEVIALDVGHGLAVLVRSGDVSILFDAGGRAPATGERVLGPALRALGVRRLAGLWISHEDSDHVDGAREVLRDMPVDEVLVPEGFGASPVAADLLRTCADTAVPVRAVRRGDRWARRGLSVAVLDPAAAAPSGAENAESLVLHALARDDDTAVSVFLPGDVEGTRLSTLVADATLPRADVLLLPHHGRGDCGPQESLARRIGATLSVASTSESSPTAVRGAWVTGIDGAVRVRPGRAPEAWPW